jgi:hypothetical protein
MVAGCRLGGVEERSAFAEFESLASRYSEYFFFTCVSIGKKKRDRAELNSRV